MWLHEEGDQLLAVCLLHESAYTGEFLGDPERTIQHLTNAGILFTLRGKARTVTAQIAREVLADLALAEDFCCLCSTFEQWGSCLAGMSGRTPCRMLLRTAAELHTTGMSLTPLD